MRSIISAISITSLLASYLLIASCGGGGGGGGSSAANDIAPSAQTGTVALLATDAPTDEFAAINLTIIKAELLSDDGRITVYEGEKEFDLLQLTEVTEIFSVSEVPEGSYNKIRLTLTEIELVFRDGREPAYPRLPGNGKLDLNPREMFYVDADQPLVVQLDFDAKKSIHVVKTGNRYRYNFRPVVFVEIIESEFDTKLIRQRGTINQLDLAAGEFKLCLIEEEAQPISSDRRPDCVTVDTDTAPASLFDDFANPVELSDYDLGDIVTVVGRFRLSANGTLMSNFNNGNGKGKGKGNSKKPGDRGDDPGEDFRDDEDRDDEPDDIRDGDDSDDDRDDDANEGTLNREVVLVADVIWRGNDIEQSDNIACSRVTAGTSYQNALWPLPEGTTCDSEARTTILQPGARIYDADGREVAASSITQGVLNQVDGYINTGATPQDLKAVLVMLGASEDEDEEIQWTGIIGDLNPGTSLILITDEGDRCVNFSETDTRAFIVDEQREGNTVFEPRDLSELMTGQRILTTGLLDAEGCLNADVIIFEEEDAIEPPM